MPPIHARTQHRHGKVNFLLAMRYFVLYDPFLFCSRYAAVFVCTGVWSIVFVVADYCINILPHPTKVDTRLRAQVVACGRAALFVTGEAALKN